MSTTFKIRSILYILDIYIYLALNPDSYFFFLPAVADRRPRNRAGMEDVL